MDYKNIAAPTLEELEPKVKAYIKNGWEPEGSVLKDNGMFVQTIVHKETVKQPPVRSMRRGLTPNDIATLSLIRNLNRF